MSLARNRNTLSKLRALLVVILIPSRAWAHHAEWMSDQPLIQGLSMPIHGLGHMLVAIAVGLVAARLGRTRSLLLSSIFLLFMCFAGLLNVTGTSIPWIEEAGTASILILALVIGRGSAPAFVPAAVLVGLCAAIQGSELVRNDVTNPSRWSYLLFVFGVLGGAVALMTIGAALGLALQSLRRGEYVSRYAGAAIALVGMVAYLFPGADQFVIRLLE